jgi:hypothetical protein
MSINAPHTTTTSSVEHHAVFVTGDVYIWHPFTKKMRDITTVCVCVRECVVYVCFPIVVEFASYEDA